jgi:uncharacterized membrane protein
MKQSTKRIEGAARWLVRHWLAVANTMLLLYAGLPFLSPLAKAAGYPLIGELVFRIYTPLCHQRPERSFFVCGHQVAFCHRCTAMYGGMVVLGVLFAAVRRWVAPLPIKIGALMMVPIAIDGGTHLLDDLLGLGLRAAGGDGVGSPNFMLRMVTGVLFALAAIWILYPRLDPDMRAASAEERI